ncbi:hypothetical protein [Streptomyces sp. NPDC048438]|uniref:hypothetical protein n=1 Tax=Streptomyces sp. NPDC048438 TaxID=3365551 RepID=UPI00372350E0
MRRSWRPTASEPSREGSQAKDDEIRTRFDGRGRVELMPGHATGPRRQRIEDMAHALGYRLLSAENLGRLGIRLVHERDVSPLAWRRNELSVVPAARGWTTAAGVGAASSPDPALRTPRSWRGWCLPWAVSGVP